MLDIVVTILNDLIRGLGAILGFLISVLPNSPFQSIIDSSVVSDYLGGLAWVIPFPALLSVFTAWAGCMALYYLYSIVLRWVKAIE